MACFKSSLYATPQNISKYIVLQAYINNVLLGLKVLLKKYSARANTKYNPISKVAVIGFMNPIFGVILSTILLKEGTGFGLAAVISLLLICIGIIIVNIEKKKEAAQFAKPMEQYSEGQKKKVLIAASLLTSAHLYIWDEPLNYIDVFTRMQVEKLIETYKPTMLFVEHDVRFKEKIATKIISL